MLHANYQGSRPYGFKQEDCFIFPYKSIYKSCDPGGHFVPQEHNKNKLGRGLIGDATYQISRL